jgi:ubiquinone biosynthesis O-methyltransferase
MPDHRVVAILYGLTCHTLFAIGVGTMIAAMFYGMSRSLGRVAPPWSLLANAGLLLQFPLGHSLLLGGAGRRILGEFAPRQMGGRMATTIFVIAASLQVFLLFAFWTPSGTVWWRAEGATLWVVVSAYTAAWLLLLKAIWDAGLALQTGFLGWWAIFRRRAPVFPPMPTTGLFRFVRQPIYVAFTLTLWSVPTWTPDQLAVAAVLTCYCLIGPLMKEARFRQRFGAAFVAYTRQVPFWLPRVRASRARNDLSIYCTDWWGHEARWLQALRGMVPARLAVFDPIVGDWSRKRVLDLGCGGGFMAEAMAARGATVTGIDPATAAIDAARLHSGASGVAIDYLVASGEALPFAAATFDVVVCVDVLEHIEAWDLVVAEVRRVLRPRGLFLFDTINRNPLAAFVIVTIGENLIRLLPHGIHDPALFIRPAELKRALELNGFIVGRFAGLGPRRLNRRLGLTFGSLPITAVQYIGHARVAEDVAAP